ncbi:MAG: hypothetical protein HOO10_04865 [Candidatus Marinimicrobia bacterium]|jgi:hypothetical protein|nr:hypothetical protein [Candidatus Neomarinimicrobiota bacterium]
MQLCFNCSLKKECNTSCDRVESYLKEKRNYKTTYVNKEVGISDIVISMESKRRQNSNSQRKSTSTYHKRWMMVMNVITSKRLTKKQTTAIWFFLEGRSMAAIGKRMGVSAQTIHTSIFGHPKHGGGAVRKIQKTLNLCR